jgi:hypothetical protein
MVVAVVVVIAVSSLDSPIFLSSFVSDADTFDKSKILEMAIRNYYL